MGNDFGVLFRCRCSWNVLYTCRAEWLWSLWPPNCRLLPQKVALKGNSAIVRLPPPTFLMSMWTVSYVGKNFNSWELFKLFQVSSNVESKVQRFPFCLPHAEYTQLPLLWASSLPQGATLASVHLSVTIPPKLMVSFGFTLSLKGQEFGHDIGQIPNIVLPYRMFTSKNVWCSILSFFLSPNLRQPLWSFNSLYTFPETSAVGIMHSSGLSDQSLSYNNSIHLRFLHTLHIWRLPL